MKGSGQKIFTLVYKGSADHEKYQDFVTECVKVASDLGVTIDVAEYDPATVPYSVASV